jgi:tripartite ATP-independent transporter DctP family solute receptor
MSTGCVRFLYRCVVLACAVAAWLGPGPASAREFRAADIQDETYPTVQALRFMDRLVTERTGGVHRIRVFHSRQLGEESQTIEQTRVGAIDINRINVGAIGDVAPALNVLALPFLFRSLDHLYKVIDGPIGDEILGSLEPHGFVGLTFYDSGARSIYTATKPVRALADLRGMRLRVQQSDLMERMMRALNAEPVGLPYGQVLTALSTRLVDGAENNWPSFIASGHYRLARYYTVTEHTMGPEVVIMSRRAWDELAPQDRIVFRAAAKESSRYMRGTWLNWEQESRKTAAEAGVTVINDIVRKPFDDATSGIREGLRGDPKYGPLMGRIQAVQ